MYRVSSVRQLRSVAVWWSVTSLSRYGVLRLRSGPVPPRAPLGRGRSVWHRRRATRRLRPTIRFINFYRRRRSDDIVASISSSHRPTRSTGPRVRPEVERIVVHSAVAANSSELRHVTSSGAAVRPSATSLRRDALSTLTIRMKCAQRQDRSGSAAGRPGVNPRIGRASV